MSRDTLPELTFCGPCSSRASVGPLLLLARRPRLLLRCLSHPFSWANRTVGRNMSHFRDRSVYAPQRPRSQEGRFRCVVFVHICDVVIVTITAKGAWKVPTSAPVYLRHVHLPGAPLTTHAREQQEAHLRAPASLRLDPPCPRRARFDQNNRAWRTWSLLWGKEGCENGHGKR